MRAVRRRCLPMVVDADGLWLVNQDPSLVQGGQAGHKALTMPGPACLGATVWAGVCSVPD